MSAKKHLFEIFTGIRGRILLSFSFLIVIFLVSAVISNRSLKNTENVIIDYSENIDPSLVAIKDLKLLIVESRMLSANWVYLMGDFEDKEALRKLFKVDYPKEKQKIISLASNWEDSKAKMMAFNLLKATDALIKNESAITQLLSTFEDYETPLKKYHADDIMETKVIPDSKKVLSDLQVLMDLMVSTQKKSFNMIKSTSNTLSLTITILSAIVLFSGIFMAFYMANSLIVPINYLKDVVDKLAHGDISDIKLKESHDEIGEMTEGMKKLVAGFARTAHFAEHVGKGHLDEHFEPLSEVDILGNSLVNMRNNLQKIKVEEAQRAWISVGVSDLGELMRNNATNLNNLLSLVLRELIKYLQASVGGVYILKKESDNIYIKLETCYAYSRQKYIVQNLEYGEGLVGQSIKDKDFIFITEIPEDYINVVSGLGDALPACILIVPLIYNDEAVGAVELVSFNIFEPYQIEFVQKIAEGAASFISTTIINEHTKKLLEESQIQSELLRTQEEEMRQNMEELNATQEELIRKESDLQEKLQTLLHEKQNYIDRIKTLENKLGGA